MHFQKTYEQKDIPVDTSKIIFKAMFIAFFAVFVFIIWLMIAELSSGTIATGTVMPETETKIIQHLEGGIIEKVYVSDNTLVKEGDLILSLDQSEINASIAILQNQYDALDSVIKRLIAESEGRELALSDTFDKLPTSIQTQWKLFKIRGEALKKDNDILAQHIVQTEQEIQALESEKEALETNKASLSEEIATAKSLYKSRYIEKTQYHNIHNQFADVKGRLARNEAEISQAKQKIIETRMQMTKLEHDWKTRVYEELVDVQTRIKDVQEKQGVMLEKLKRTIVKSPLDGRIKEIKFKLKGGVISPGGIVVEIVPTEEKLVVEAEIDPDHIDNVTIGMKSFVKFTAYNRRKQDPLEGEVVAISADTFKNDRTDVSYYKVMVEISKEELQRNKNVNLQPGMLAQVEIVLGTKTAMYYLLDPLIASIDRAFKED